MNELKEYQTIIKLIAFEIKERILDGRIKTRGEIGAAINNLAERVVENQHELILRNSQNSKIVEEEGWFPEEEGNEALWAFRKDVLNQVDEICGSANLKTDDSVIWSLIW